MDDRDGDTVEEGDCDGEEDADGEEDVVAKVEGLTLAVRLPDAVSDALLDPEDVGLALASTLLLGLVETAGEKIYNCHWR